MIIQNNVQKMRKKNARVRLIISNRIRFLQREDKSEHRHGPVLKTENNF